MSLDDDTQPALSRLDSQGIVTDMTTELVTPAYTATADSAPFEGDAEKAHSFNQAMLAVCDGLNRLSAMTTDFGLDYTFPRWPTIDEFAADFPGPTWPTVVGIERELWPDDPWPGGPDQAMRGMLHVLFEGPDDSELSAHGVLSTFEMMNGDRTLADQLVRPPTVILAENRQEKAWDITTMPAEESADD